jgi:uncharacterized protein
VPDESSVATAFWRRLDVPGHDACRLERRALGWRLEGTAVFRERGATSRLDYVVECDARWRTTWGTVHGWRGAARVAHRAERDADGAWTLDGVLVPGVHGALDLDLAFTPATNMLQLRRVALAVGAAADVPVAWLDDATWTLAPLPQRYERRGEGAYWYESPTADYRALLEVRADAFATRYPGLWEAEG